MFGMKRPIDTTINTRVDHLAELKAAVHRACSVAEDSGVHLALIRDFFQGCHTQYVQRAMVAIDVANARAQAPSDAVARAQAVKAARADRQLQAEREAYREDVNRRGAEEEERRWGSR